MTLAETIQLSILAFRWGTYANELAAWERGVVKLVGMSYEPWGEYRGRNQGCAPTTHRGKE